MKFFLGFLVLWGPLIGGLAQAKGKTLIVNLPIVSMGGEATTKIEYNLQGVGGIGLEFTTINEQELYTDDEIRDNQGDSILVRGGEAALTLSRYGNSMMMSGGYWTLGVGYRRVEANWTRTPDEEFSPRGVSLDSDGRFTHDLVSVGITGRARVGYRYVAESIPLAVGAYIGVRHFENKFSDSKDQKGVETPIDDQESLSRRIMSELEPGIELGLAF